MNEYSLSKCVSYIIQFLLGEGNEQFQSMVSYGNREGSSVVIERSSFFDDGVYMTSRSLPEQPFQSLDGVPVLFGDPSVLQHADHSVIQADIVASSFFLLTRYEECVRRDVRDEHGRFRGRDSTPFLGGFIETPIVDRYGQLLRSVLRAQGVDIPDPRQGYRKVRLTHDIDHAWTWDSPYRAFKSATSRLVKGGGCPVQPIMAIMNYKRYDPAYTFEWMMSQDARACSALGRSRCESLYFLMGSVKKTMYDTGYMRNESRTRDLVTRLGQSGCSFGYHVSYEAANNHPIIGEELGRVSKHVGHSVTSSRNHYLDSKEPEDYRSLIDNGITDDYTMTYADVAGFRIGTSRPVRWIDPVELVVTDLVLHPTTIMECTLDSSSYMGIDRIDEAFRVVKELLDKTRDNAGEVVLLWHNTSVGESSVSYQRELYERVIDYIIASDNAITEACVSIQ